MARYIKLTRKIKNSYTWSLKLKSGSLIRIQQRNYASHVMCMPHERAIKQLMFNDDCGTKRGRPTKTLLEQVICSEIVTLDQFCNLSIGRRF